MMKITSTLVLAPLFFSVFMISAAYAEDQSTSDLPPQVINLDEEEPAVAHSKKQIEQQTVQTIQNGGQTEVRVTNEVGTYIVKPNQSEGNSVPGDAQSSSNHAVQWIVKSWGGSKSTVPNETPPTLPENPDYQTHE